MRFQLFYLHSPYHHSILYRFEYHLCNDCLKPVKGISLTQRGVGKKIADHILSKTEQLVKTYGLCAFFLTGGFVALSYANEKRGASAAFWGGFQ